MKTRQKMPRCWKWLLICTAAAGLILFPGIGAPAAYADCADADEDGYGTVATDCPNPEIDCNDDNPAVNPGASETCNYIDDDCDGDIDETFDVGAYCTLSDPPGCLSGDPDGCCLTLSTKVCLPDGSGTYCPVPVSGLATWSPEGPAGSPSCYDLNDNDCDGLTDFEEVECFVAELCNGLDDNGDGFADEGFNLGAACSDGVGACTRNGVFICDADQQGSHCSAVAGAPVSENTPGAGVCIDLADNDCDGLTDLDDPDCHGPELCDGNDNDGDGMIDEGFDVGVPCTLGIGACAADGAKVCRPDRTGTVCNAIPGLASTEGPTGPTCSDGLDNDCDGNTDSNDADCNSALLYAWCALPYTLGEHGDDCTGKHQIRFGAAGAGVNATISAELIALDLQGNLMDAMPVQNGEVAHLASRIDPLDYKFRMRKQLKGQKYEVFAPVPMLHVMVRDGLNTSEAFCSPIPYLDVVQPAGTVVSQSEGDATGVVAGIPLNDPHALSVKVDGVEILPALGIDPAAAFPGGPYSGDVMINGKSVHISELIVRSGAIDVQSSNTLTMRLEGLGCGGHIIVVGGEKRPGSFPDNPTIACLVDDLRDKGTSSGMSVEISSPAPGQVVAAVPTPVTGQVCGGTPIASVKINGKPLDVSGVTFTPGDGEDSGDLYVLPIDTTLDRTNLAQDLSTGDAPLGTFDAGSNRLVAEVTDDTGHRAFKSLIFATGAVASPGIGPLASSLRYEVERQLNSAFASESGILPLAGGVEISNAFVVGLTPGAINTMFSEKCKDKGQLFVDTVIPKILATPWITKSVSGGCSCNPPVGIGITGATANAAEISCPVAFQDGKIHVTVNLPTLTIYGHAGGWCKTTFLGACVAETIVNVNATTTISGIKLDFDITEAQLLGAAPLDPVFVQGTASVVTSGGSEVNCLAAACNWALEGLVFIFTFGQVDLDLSPSIDISKVQEFTKEVGASEPDPIELGEIKVDEEEVADFGQFLKGDLETVEITPAGLTAGLKGTFSTASIDPSIPPTPGAILTPAPSPATPIPGGGDAYVVLADDTFNQMFASMAASGKLNLGCQPSGKTVGDLLPADCETLTGATDLATALVQGLCHGIRGTDCETLTGPTDLTTATEQGVCHGTRGDTCSSIPTDVLPLIERTACSTSPNLNMTATMPLLFCTQQEMPPRLLIQDNNVTPAIETALRLNDLSVAMVVDRDSNGLGGELPAVPKCFGTGAPTVGDCNLFAACLDLNFLTSSQFQTCADGKPGIRTNFDGIQILDRQTGVVCGGATEADDGQITTTASDSDVIDLLGGNVTAFTPPVCANGLNLGGLVNFSSPRLVAVETDGEATFQDYLGVTGNITAPAP